MDTYDRIIYEKSHQVVIMPFDKVMGQFTLQEHHKLLFELEDSPEKVLFNREIQFQVSKLNAIVFDYNNTEHDSSLAHMYGIYKTEVFVTGILCILLLVALFMSAQILGYISSTSPLTQVASAATPWNSSPSSFPAALLCVPSS